MTLLMCGKKLIYWWGQWSHVCFTFVHNDAFPSTLGLVSNNIIFFLFSTLSCLTWVFFCHTPGQGKFDKIEGNCWLASLFVSYLITCWTGFYFGWFYFLFFVFRFIRNRPSVPHKFRQLRQDLHVSSSFSIWSVGRGTIKRSFLKIAITLNGGENVS